MGNNFASDHLSFLPGRGELDVFPVANIIDNSVTDFDLFAKAGPYVVLYSGSGYRWQRSELQDLIKQGCTSLWIRTSDIPKANAYFKLASLSEVSKTLPPEDRLQRIQDIGGAFTRYLFEADVTSAAVEVAKDLSSHIVSCVEEDPGCVRAITGLADHDQYTYLHSVRVSAYAVAIAYQLGLRDTELLRELALGGIFHDIGKSAIPMTVINKSGPLVDTEWKLMRTHPMEGLNKIQDTCLNFVTREVIVHHHERLNGSGYPHGLSENSLITEVQIATLADIYDALTSSRSYQNKRSRFEALDFIKNKLLKTDVSVDAYKGLIACLIR